GLKESEYKNRGQGDVTPSMQHLLIQLNQGGDTCQEGNSRPRSGRRCGGVGSLAQRSSRSARVLIALPVPFSWFCAATAGSHLEPEVAPPEHCGLKSARRSPAVWHAACRSVRLAGALEGQLRR